jgi:hypothetical protein
METRAPTFEATPRADSMSAKSDDSGQATSRFNLLLNPFILLGVPPNATAQEITHAYEDAVEEAVVETDVLRRAQQELLTPRLRVNAEVSGLLDVAPSLASRLTSKLRQDSARAQWEDLIHSLHALPKSNVIAHLAAQSNANIDDLMELLQAQATITAGGVHEAISDAREAAGSAKVDPDSVVQALVSLEERQVKAVIAKAITNDTFPTTFDSFVARVLATTDASLIAKLDVYVRAYSQALAPELSKRREAVATACATVRGNPKNTESIAKILRELRRWSEIAHPLQLFESHMHREEPQARDLFLQVREVCIWLANDQQAYEVARIITQYCAEIFKELPRAFEQMKEEIGTLSQLCMQKTARTLLEPLSKVLAEVDANHRQLEKELLKNGFGAQSTGLAKRIYDQFTKAVIATVGTEIADLPWRLVRDTAISLNNNSQSPKAAAAIIGGLVFHFTVRRPSDEVVIVLKNDQEKVNKNIVQEELVSSLKRGRLASAATLVERLIEIEQDANEVATLKQARDGIVAKRRSSKLKWCGWIAAAVVFALLAAAEARTNRHRRHRNGATALLPTALQKQLPMLRSSHQWAGTSPLVERIFATALSKEFDWKRPDLWP